MHLAFVLGLALAVSSSPSSSPSKSSPPPSPPAPIWPDLTTLPGGAGPGRGDAAVVIGISAYRSLPPLPGAAETATRFATWLKDGRGIPAQRVKLLLDKEATAEAIRAAVQTLAATGTGSGVMWLVYIGHGAPHGNGDDGLILPVDVLANRSAVDRFGIPQRELIDLIDAADHRSAVAIFDATFSRLRGDGVTPLVEGWEERLPNRRLRSPPRKTDVLAAHDGCAPILPGGGRPAFSYLFLGALQGWGDNNGDGVVDSGEAMRFTQETMPRCVAHDERLPVWTPGPVVSLGTTVRVRRDIEPALAAMKAMSAVPPSPPSSPSSSPKR